MLSGFQIRNLTKIYTNRPNGRKRVNRWMDEKKKKDGTRPICHMSLHHTSAITNWYCHVIYNYLSEFIAVIKQETALWNINWMSDILQVCLQKKIGLTNFNNFMLPHNVPSPLTGWEKNSNWSCTYLFYTGSANESHLTTKQLFLALGEILIVYFLINTLILPNSSFLMSMCMKLLYATHLKQMGNQYKWPQGDNK